MASPLLNIHCISEIGCKYPTVLKVAMDDGTVQEYVLNAKVQPPVRFDFQEMMNSTMEHMDSLFDCFEIVEPDGTRHKKYRNG